MTTILFLVLFWFTPSTLEPINKSFFGPFILVIFLTTFVIPALSVTIFKYTNMISDIALRDRRERVLPFVFASIFYLITTGVFLFRFSINQTVNVVFVATSILILMMTVITLFWKISVHGAGAGGMAGFLIAFTIKDPVNLLFVPMLLAIVASGLVMSARLQLDAHTPRQVYGGWALGVVTGFVAVFWFL